MSDEEQVKDSWDKVRSVGTLASVTLIPIVLAYLGNKQNTTIKSQETQTRLVELAVDVLTGDPRTDDPSDAKLREWAADILGIASSRTMSVELTKPTREALQRAPLRVRPRITLSTDAGGAAPVREFATGLDAFRRKLMEKARAGRITESDIDSEISAAGLAHLVRR